MTKYPINRRYSLVFLKYHAGYIFVQLVLAVCIQSLLVSHFCLFRLRRLILTLE